MFGLVSLNQNKVVTYMLINLYLVCLETSPPFIHRKSGRSAQEGKGAGDWWIGAVFAVMRTVYQPAVVKRKLRLKEELSIYRSVYVPTVMYDHELWIVTERMRFQIQGNTRARLPFEAQRVAWLFLRHTLRSFWWVLLLHFAGGSPLRWFVHLTARPPECPLYEVLGHTQLEGNPKAHPRKAERTTVCFLAGLGTPQCLQKIWRRWLEKEAWESLLRLWPLQPRLAAENGWIDEICHISAKMGISQGIS